MATQRAITLRTVPGPGAIGLNWNAQLHRCILACGEAGPCGCRASADYDTDGALLVTLRKDAQDAGPTGDPPATPADGVCRIETMIDGPGGHDDRPVSPFPSHHRSGISSPDAPADTRQRRLEDARRRFAALAEHQDPLTRRRARYFLALTLFRMGRLAEALEQSDAYRAVYGEDVDWVELRF